MRQLAKSSPVRKSGSSSLSFSLSLSQSRSHRHWSLILCRTSKVERRAATCTPHISIFDRTQRWFCELTAANAKGCAVCNMLRYGGTRRSSVFFFSCQMNERSRGQQAGVWTSWYETRVFKPHLDCTQWNQIQIPFASMTISFFSHSLNTMNKILQVFL